MIVDGYNIIGAWPELAKLKDVNLEEARDRLINRLSEYQSFTGIKVLLVFDAYYVPGIGGKYTQSKLRIYYTKEKETADELIERLVNDLIARRRTIYVATSDMTEQHVIFGKGALRMPAGELKTKVTLAKKDISTQIRDQSTTRKNSVDSKLSPDMRDLFEKWRRGK